MTTMNNETAQDRLVLVLKDAHKDLSQLLNKLQLAQYVVVVVQNKQDYMGLIQIIKPNSIVLDLLLLDADGWNIARKIKQNPDTNSIPLVLINSSPQSMARVARLEWQNVSCVSEASEPEKIVDSIDARLSESNRDRERANTTVDKIDKGLEGFASIISEDLKTHLRSLSMFSELLTNEYQQDLDSKAREYLKEIGNSSSKMQAFMEDLLTYSRAGKSDRTWSEIDLNQAISVAIANLHLEIAASQAQITVDELPKVMVNPTEINQLLQNLLENAIKFSPGQNPQIKVRATARKEQWIIYISDCGIGIAPELQAEIFEPFKRLNSAEDYPGTGIGLAVCQKIVERYGGKIGVESVVGKGSSFYFTLPTDAYLPPRVAN